MSAGETLCACGCGAVLTPDDQGRVRRFVRGHHKIGVKHSAETRAKLSAIAKRAWADPNIYIAFRDQSPEMVEKRAAKLRGRKHSPERIEQKRARVKADWQAGKYDGLTGASADHMRRIGQLVDMKKLREINSVLMAKKMQEWKDSGQLEKIRLKARIATGMLDHLHAKCWTIRDPSGGTYSFSNLSEWARQHEHLFEDCAPASRHPHWRRIASGISQLLKVNGNSCSYRGWVAVSKSELENGAPDFLAREMEANPRPELETKLDDN